MLSTKSASVIILPLTLIGYRGYLTEFLLRFMHKKKNVHKTVIFHAYVHALIIVVKTLLYYEIES